MKWISEGAFATNEDTGQAGKSPIIGPASVFDPLNFTGVPPNFRLIPGMTLTADVNVGRRSLGAYLLESLIKGAGGACASHDTGGLAALLGSLGRLAATQA